MLRLACQLSTAIFFAVAVTGCRQSTSPTAPTMPWQRSSYLGPAGEPQSQSFLAQLMRRQDLQSQLAQEQRRQLEQLAEMQRDLQEKTMEMQQEKLRQWQQQTQEGSQLAQRQLQNGPQLEALRTRANQLDAKNRDLHSELAQSQQQRRLLEDQVSLLRQQLNETAQQLATTLRAKEASEDRVAALQASTRRRGGATITANSSVKTDLTAISVPGVQVRQDGDVVRMELPSAALFVPQSATLNPGAMPLLEKVAKALAENYPRQIIGIEAHTDSDPVAGTAWRSNHQLSAAQAMAVFDQFVQNQNLSPHRLFVLGHGPNHPVASNATPAGKARNRRVEIVIYPETIE